MASLLLAFTTPIGQASMQTPQLGHEYTCSLAIPLRACRTGIPAFLIGMSRISAGMCMYLLNGRMHMNMHRAIEYAHQVGSMFIWSLRKEWSTRLSDLVRNDPPLMSAVKPSARSLSGKIAQREYSPIRSVRLALVVRLIPNILERALFIIARTMPLSTTRRKKSIRKKKNDPFMVLSVTATKYLKNIGYHIWCMR